MAEKERKRLKETKNYFTSTSKPLEFIPSGCTLLDCVLGGGWPLGRISNVIGSASSGKTLLAIEACANFIQKFPEGKVYYQEAEAAFDKLYAADLGMPIDDINFIERAYTAESFGNKLIDITRGRKANKGVPAIEALDKDIPKLYILDSLDALAVTKESRQDFDEGGFAGARKAGYMSELFRKLGAEVEVCNMHLMIISQVRANVGVMFGPKHTVSGGNALNHHAAQRLWLNDLGKIKKVRNKIERTIGLKVKAKCHKNKVGLPQRECEFPIYYGYGVNDYEANLNFLNGHFPEDIEEIAGCPNVKKVIKLIEDNDDRELEIKLSERVVQRWNEIEETFMPKRKKYR